MRASNKYRSIDITGKLTPWYIDRPIVVTIQFKPYVAIYSSKHKLRASMRECGIEAGYTIQRIEDGKDFIDWLHQQPVLVCLNPHRVGDTVEFFAVDV